MHACHDASGTRISVCLMRAGKWSVCGVGSNQHRIKMVHFDLACLALAARRTIVGTSLARRGLPWFVYRLYLPRLLLIPPPCFAPFSFSYSCADRAKHREKVPGRPRSTRYFAQILVGDLQAQTFGLLSARKQEVSRRLESSSSEQWTSSVYRVRPSRSAFILPYRVAQGGGGASTFIQKTPTLCCRLRVQSCTLTRLEGDDNTLNQSNLA